MGFSPRLAGILAPRFSVTAYDRRGRGASDDTAPFAVEREIEDIDALIDAAGGSAALFGISSGAALALQAAVKLDHKVTAVALYEPPYNDDDAPLWRDYRRQLGELLAADRRGDAIELFMRFVGVPSEQIEAMRGSPMWPALEAVAPTLAYDAAGTRRGPRRAHPAGGAPRVAGARDERKRGLPVHAHHGEGPAQPPCPPGATSSSPASGTMSTRRSSRRSWRSSSKTRRRLGERPPRRQRNAGGPARTWTTPAAAPREGSWRGRADRTRRHGPRSSEPTMADPNTLCELHRLADDEVLSDVALGP